MKTKDKYRIDIYYTREYAQKTIHKVDDLKEALKLFSEAVINIEDNSEVLLIDNNRRVVICKIKSISIQ